MVDTHLFISYLTSDNLERHLNLLVQKVQNVELELFCPSETYDDLSIALLTQGVSGSECSRFLAETKLIPHESMQMTAEIASKALKLYSEYGGRRRLHYFDAFHVSTVAFLNMIFYTSDKYVANSGKKLGIYVMDIRTLEKNNDLDTDAQTYNPEWRGVSGISKVSKLL